MDNLSTVIKETLLTCSICLVLFTKPKILPCLHTFCLECITQHFNKSKNGVNARCPTCRDIFTLPDENAENLKSNFYINSLTEVVRTKTTAVKKCSFCLLKNVNEKAYWMCIECSDFLCNKCKDNHLGTRITFTHHIISVVELVSGTYDKELRNTYRLQCEKHKDEILKFYCETCSSTVCRDCILLEHKKHVCLTTGAAITTKREEIEVLLRATEKQIESLVAKRVYFVDALSTVEQDEVSNISSLKDYGLSLKETVDKTIQKAKAEIRKVSEESKKTLSTRKNEIGKQIDILERPFQFCKELLAEGRDEEILYFQDTLKDGLSKYQQQEDILSELTWDIASVSMPEEVNRYIREEVVKCVKTPCTLRESPVHNCDDIHNKGQSESTNVSANATTPHLHGADVDGSANAVANCDKLVTTKTDSRAKHNTTKPTEEVKAKFDTTKAPTYHSQMFKLSHKFSCMSKLKPVLPIDVAWLNNQEIAVCDSANGNLLVFSKLGLLSWSFKVDKPTNIAVCGNRIAISNRSKVMIVENDVQKGILSFPTGAFCRIAASLSHFLLFRNDITTVRMYNALGLHYEKDFPFVNVVIPPAVSSNKKTILISDTQKSSILMLNHKGFKLGEIKHATKSRLPHAHCMQDNNVILLDKQSTEVHILKDGEELLEKWSTVPEIKEPTCLDYHQDGLLVIGGACETGSVHEVSIEPGSCKKKLVWT
ncbi:protein PML-like [Ylistrum balloti]|uniref:protein PML-like n=1 Tax=Ylistrum balloti TaxID=509963 RepID=UPI0029059B50|nr:protein PML-like [Ylistrum balloti]